MIVCKDVSKSYGEQRVLSSLSYTFGDTGFYLLWGESGSGKTTFLNILSGFTDFDGGTVTAFGKSYEGRVNNREISDRIDYITQDAYFADYLTVEENLHLVSDDDEGMERWLRAFGLEDKKRQYPKTLSGGERQRLALIRALLGGRKILFLDEPTASLDGENKREIFGLLASIKNEVLILCATHDGEAKAYADDVLLFDKNRVEMGTPSIAESPEKAEENAEKRETGRSWKKLYLYMKKWFSSKERNRSGEVKLAVFLLTAFLLCLFSDVPAHKVAENNEFVYKINMLTVMSSEPIDFYGELKTMDGVRDVTICYSENVPIPLPTLEQIEQGIPLALPDYERSAPVLPFDKKSFRLSNKMAYGTYFTGENQVILSMNEAKRLMPEHTESLIGSHITKKLWAQGAVRLEIVGIFQPMNANEEMYFKGMDLSSDRWYISSKQTVGYADREDFSNGGKRTYLLFFDSYRDAAKFLEENQVSFAERDILLRFSGSLETAKYNEIYSTSFIIGLPLAAFMSLIAVLFYAYLIKTELLYNSANLSVFEYAGYSIRRVTRSFALVCLLRVLLLELICGGMALILAFTVNAVNTSLVLVGFRIFTLSPLFLSAFAVAILLLTAVIVWGMLGKLKNVSWYGNLLSQRDLI